MSWTIYCHMHTESQRRYIGLTKRTMERRWAQHVCQAKSAKGGRWHFPNAIRKYGPEAFEHFVLETCETLEEANAAEQRWISHFNSRDPLFGFNLAEGGKHEPHPIRKNPWDDPEYRAKNLPGLVARTNTPAARANNKASLNSPESKARRSAISKAMPASVKAKISAKLVGRTLSEDHRAHDAAAQRGHITTDAARKKLSAAMTGRKRSLESIAENTRHAIEDGVLISKLCRVHGCLGPDDCYVWKRGDKMRIACKKCAQHRRRSSTSLQDRPAPASKCKPASG